MIKPRKQKGFALLEILIAVIVILGLTLWWVKMQAHKSEQRTATQMTQQINQIMNATVNYYEKTAVIGSTAKQWPLANLTADQLITAKYLTAANKINPFGQDYTLSADTTNHLEILTTTIPANHAYLANKAIEPLTNASVVVDNKANTATITVNLPEPAAFTIGDAEAVRYMAVAHSGDVIPFTAITCPDDVHYDKKIYTSIQGCVGTGPTISGGAVANQPLESCQSAANPITNGWQILMLVLTPSGWIDASNSPLNKVQVALRCVKKTI